jgi:hypothetical protein
MNYPAKRARDLGAIYAGGATHVNKSHLDFVLDVTQGNARHRVNPVVAKYPKFIVVQDHVRDTRGSGMISGPATCFSKAYIDHKPILYYFHAREGTRGRPFAINVMHWNVQGMTDPTFSPAARIKNECFKEVLKINQPVHILFLSEVSYLFPKTPIILRLPNGKMVTYELVYEHSHLYSSGMPGTKNQRVYIQRTTPPLFTIIRAGPVRLPGEAQHIRPGIQIELIPNNPQTGETIDQKIVIQGRHNIASSNLAEKQTKRILDILRKEGKLPYQQITSDNPAKRKREETHQPNLSVYEKLREERIKENEKKLQEIFGTNTGGGIFGTNTGGENVSGLFGTNKLGGNVTGLFGTF